MSGEGKKEKLVIPFLYVETLGVNGVIKREIMNNSNLM